MIVEVYAAEDNGSGTWIVQRPALRHGCAQTSDRTEAESVRHDGRQVHTQQNRQKSTRYVSVLYPRARLHQVKANVMLISSTKDSEQFQYYFHVEKYISKYSKKYVAFAFSPRK